MFLRNPIERLLSAYLDKVNGMKRDKDHFLMNYNMTHTPSFEEFVNIISENRIDFELGSKTREKLQGVDWRKLENGGAIQSCMLSKQTELTTSFLLSY